MKKAGFVHMLCLLKSTNSNRYKYSAADRFCKNEQYKETSKNSVFGFFGNLTGGWIIVFLLYVKITYHVSEERVLLHISHLEVVTVK